MHRLYPGVIRFDRAGSGVVRCACAFVLLLGPASIAAHEIPRSVTVLAFLKADSHHLRLVVRLPLEAIRDVNLPLRGPGYLDLRRLAPLLANAAKTWIADDVRLYEDDSKLPPPRIVAARVSLPSDRSFESYDRAVAHTVADPLPDSTNLAWQQAMLDVLLEYPIASDRARFSIDPALGRLGVHTTTVLRFVTPDGAERAFQYRGDPGLVRLDPRWHQASLRFVTLGFQHILDGIDHLLFLVCLVIPFRRLRPLVLVVTAFTFAHSVTLIAAATGLSPSGLWFPPFIEVLIALSIVYMALENIVGPKLERRWIVAFLFGLVHGFGFSFALRDSMQFAGAHLTTSLLSFNIGVELGQLAVLALAMPALAVLFKHVVAERMGVIVLSALVAHTAWHWMLDRVATLRQYRVAWPALDAAFVASVMRGIMLLLVISGAARRMVDARAVQPTRALGSEPRVHRAFRRRHRTRPGVMQPRRAMIALCTCILGAPVSLATAQTAATAAPARTTRSGVYTADQAKRGKDVYAGSCRSCHSPMSHTGVTFAKWWRGKRLADLFTFVSEKMPKNDPGSLAPEDYADVVAYLLQMNAMPVGNEELPPNARALEDIRIETNGSAGSGGHKKGRPTVPQTTRKKP
jgi:mono/diheme cytochrome c family protein